MYLKLFLDRVVLVKDSKSYSSYVSNNIKFKSYNNEFYSTI